MMRFIFLLLISCVSFLNAQTVDHWETVVFNDDIWNYEPGSANIPSNWMQPGFNDSQWESGPGGIGYGDGDDNTMITETISLFIRTEFELIDTAVINYGILHADYDDGFVAYLNGVEIARSNVGTVGTPPAWNATTPEFFEANLYQGDIPEDFILSPLEIKPLINQGTNTLAIQVHNHDLMSSDLSSNFFLSLGISDNSTNYNNTPSWFNPPLVGTNLASNLPLVIINTTQTNTIPDEPRVQAHMGIVDNGIGQINSETDPFNGYDGFISIETRGESSQMFPKKNYGFETQLENGENNNVSLLGMPIENDWVFHGPYSDKTLLRNVLAYHLADVTDRYAPRTRMCEVIINDDYRGIYVMTEKIKRDENRLDIAKLKPEDIAGDELTGGYFFQIDRDNEDIADDGWTSAYPNNNFYAFDDPDYDELVDVQKEYLQNFMTDFENAMNAPNYIDTYQDYIDIDSWVDYLLVTELGKHIDAYKFSFNMYKTKDSNGGKLNFGPIWDFNLAFGNFNFVCNPNPAGWSYDFEGTCHDAIPFWVKKLANIPEIQNRMDCRWTQLRFTGFRTDSLTNFINNKVIEIGSARERNFDRWPVIGQNIWPNNFIGDSYEEEISYLTGWLTQRLQWMDFAIMGDCSLATDNQEIVDDLDLKIYPNPASNLLTVEMKIHNNLTPIHLNVYDVLGNFIQSIRVGNGTNTIDISAYSNGIFLYEIVDEKVALAKGKFVKLD